MSNWALKRFWSAVDVAEAEGGYTVTLDGRPIKTPQKAPLLLPSRAIAEEVAAEWREVEERVDPKVMPFTRMANSAIDKVSQQRSEIIEMLAAFGESDLLCYRAEAPDALVRRQAAQWQPWLDWAAERFGVRLEVTAGIIPKAQDPVAVSRLRDELVALSDFELTAMHDLISISGSLILALAVTDDALPAEQAWTLSRLDEDWQIAQWGADDEASEVAAFKRADFLRAHRLYFACR